MPREGTTEESPITVSPSVETEGEDSPIPSAAECDNECSRPCVDGVCNDPVEVAIGFTHSCVRFRSGGVRCWGSNQFGQLGLGHTDSIGDDEPVSSVENVNLGGPAISVSAGDHHTCAVLEGGGVRCWGNGRFGQLGYASINDVGDDEAPAEVGDVDVGGAVSEVSAGSEHTCARLEDGRVRCWGNGADGRLGYGNTRTIGDDEPPSAAGDVNLGGRAKQVIASEGPFFGGVEMDTCAVLMNGDVRCWGAPGGFLGYPDVSESIGDDETPADIGSIQLDEPVQSLAMGAGFFCGVFAGDRVRCWGVGADMGRLGYGTVDLTIGDDEPPAEAGTVDMGVSVAKVAAGVLHSCALSTEGAVRCWGHGRFLGYENDEHVGDDETPADAGDVNIGDTVIELDIGAYHACAITQAHEVRCWGEDSDGQLGLGRLAGEEFDRAVGDDPDEMPPVPVEF